MSNNVAAESEFIFSFMPGMPVTWKMLLGWADDSRYVDPAKKQIYLDAISFIRMEMGEGFFKNCGFDHPVRQKMTGLPASLGHLLFFVETLKRLKNSDSNYRLLLSKLQPREVCRSEGQYFIDIAGEYLDRNFHVRFLDELPNQKRPDIQITDFQTKETLFIEVSHMEESDDRVRINKEHCRIGNIFLRFGYDVFYSFQQLKSIDDEKMPFVIDKIKLLKDEAFQNQSLIHYADQYIDMAIAPSSGAQEYQEWCLKNNRQNGINGLTVDFNDTPRIFRQHKIRKKVKQIKAEGSGLLYLPVHILYLMTMDKPQTMMLLVEEIQKHPNLLGIVLYSDLWQPWPEIELFVMNHAYTVRLRNGIWRHTLYIQNDAFYGHLSNSNLQKIRDSII